MKMTGTWIKRGSTIELLDEDPPTRSTRGSAGEEEFLSEVPSSATPLPVRPIGLISLSLLVHAVRPLLTASMLLAANPTAPFRSGTLPSGRQAGALWGFDVSLGGGAMTANNVTCVIPHSGGHRHATTVLQEATWEPFEVVLITGGRAVLPLDPRFLLGSFSSTSGAIATRSHPIWRLASQVDVGTAAIFAYDISDSAKPRPISDVTALRSPRPNETSGRLWALVCCELVLCRTRNDFEPAGVLDAARLYPVIEVLTNAETSTIRGAVKLRRPTRSSMAHRWANGGRLVPGLITDRNNNQGLLESMLSLAGASGAALPTWENIFDYVDKNGAARTQRLVVVDRTLLTSRSDTTHRQTLDQTTEANAPSAVLKLPRQGAFDNVHIAPQMEVNLSIPLLGGIPSTPVSMAPVCAHDCLHMHWRWSRHYTAEQNLGWGPAGPYTLPGSPMVRPNQTVTLGMTSGVPGLRYEAVATAQPVNDWMVVLPHGAAYAVQVRISPAVLLDRLLYSSGLPAPVRSAITTAVAGAEDRAFAWFYFFLQFWPALRSSPRLRPLDVVTAHVPFLSRL